MMDRLKIVILPSYHSALDLQQLMVLDLERLYSFIRAFGAEEYVLSCQLREQISNVTSFCKAITVSDVSSQP